MLTSNDTNEKDNSTAGNGIFTYKPDKPQRVRGSEVFVGGLQKSVTEENIRQLFSDCGEIAEVRMMRDKDGVSKGYCFVRFTTRNAAFKSMKEKSGIIYLGKRIGVNLPTEHDSLFLGNLRKEWTSEELEKMVREVFEDIDSVGLGFPSSSGESPSQKQLNRGFAFVHFTSHAAAIRAYRIATRPDFLLGGKWRPTVDWAESEPEPDPDEMAKVTTAFVGNLPDTVTNEFLQGLFQPFGQVERVAISRKANIPVAFVQFRERADLECAIKELDSKSIDGPGKGLKFKIQVAVAKPVDKSRKRTRDDIKKPTPGNLATEGKVVGTGGALGTFGMPYPKPTDQSLRNAPHVVSLPFAIPEAFDQYDLAVASLKPAVADRLIRLFQQGFASRQEVSIQTLESLKVLPDAAAIKVLEQFGATFFSNPLSKAAYLTGLIDMGRQEMNEKVDYRGVSHGTSIPVPHSLGLEQLSYPLSGINTDPSRYDPHDSLAIPGLYPSLSAGVGAESTFPRISPAFSDPLNLSGVSNYGSGYLGSSFGSIVSNQQANTAEHRPVRFDPFTGEPYKFDPFTGQPIQTAGLSFSHLGRSI